MSLLEPLAKLCALLAGLLLTGITLMTCVSLLGRNTVGLTLVGDFELTGAAAGAAIALFMPWCQLRGGHIQVDFFTARTGARLRQALDRCGTLLMALVLGLLAWRGSVGGLNAWDTGAGTMMLGLPEWLVYAAMVPPLGLAALIALLQTLHGTRSGAPQT